MTLSGYQTLIPYAIFCLYKNSDSIYGETAKLKNGKINSFEPITEDDLKELGKLGSKYAKPLRYIITPHPDLLLFQANDDNTARLIFKTAPKKYYHIYKSDLNLKPGLRPAPGLIWNISINAVQKSYFLNIYAFKKFSAKKTVLYNVPFFNCTNFNVCLGSTKFNVDKNIVKISELIDIVIKGFFASNFSHTGGVSQINGNLHALLDELLTLDEFPLDVLKEPENKSHQLTLKTMLKEYEG